MLGSQLTTEGKPFAKGLGVGWEGQSELWTHGI